MSKANITITGLENMRASLDQFKNSMSQMASATMCASASMAEFGKAAAAMSKVEDKQIEEDKQIKALSEGVVGQLLVTKLTNCGINARTAGNVVTALLVHHGGNMMPSSVDDVHITQMPSTGVTLTQTRSDGSQVNIIVSALTMSVLWKQVKDLTPAEKEIPLVSTYVPPTAPIKPPKPQTYKPPTMITVKKPARYMTEPKPKPELEVITVRERKIMLPDE